jgi:hypothetical protein
MASVLADWITSVQGIAIFGVRILKAYKTYKM